MLRDAGLVSRHDLPGRGATPRQLFQLTESGHRELLRRLADPADVEITDRNSSVVLLAFLGHLPEPADQLRVLSLAAATEKNDMQWLRKVVADLADECPT